MEKQPIENSTSAGYLLTGEEARLYIENLKQDNKFFQKTMTQTKPILITAIEMIVKLAEGAVLQENAENADYFSSIKKDGKEFNVYIKEYKRIQ